MVSPNCEGVRLAAYACVASEMIPTCCCAFQKEAEVVFRHIEIFQLVRVCPFRADATEQADIIGRAIKRRFVVELECRRRADGLGRHRHRLPGLSAERISTGNQNRTAFDVIGRGEFVFSRRGRRIGIFAGNIRLAGRGADE